MSYRLIACDLDETLLNDAHVICQRNSDSILHARQKYGIKFVPATGRGYYSVTNELKALHLLDQANEYVISNNGGIITENRENRLLYFKGLDYFTMSKIFKFGLLHNVCIHVYTSDKFFVFRSNAEEVKRLSNQHLLYTLVNDDTIDFLRDLTITKIVFQHPNLSFLHSLEIDIEPFTQGHCTVSYSSNRYMEFNALGVNKGEGLKILVQLLNIDLADTIAIGDNYNDIAMLKVAGLSIAARNAVQEVKDICDYTTVADNNEGVVAEVIEKFIN